MKWGVENVKVTLKDESGETVVIEQGRDGLVRCAQAKPKSASDMSPGKSERRQAEPAAPQPAAGKPEETHRAPAAERRDDSPRRAKGPRKPRKSKAEAQPEVQPAAPKGRPGSLEWSPAKDGKAWGILAKSPGGQFKILRTASSIWALFFERLDGNGALVAQPEPLGCFPIDQEDKARARAQQHHDKGMALAPIMAEAVYEMCPAPAPGSGEARQTRRGRKPKAPEAANTAPSADPPPPVRTENAEPEVNPEVDAQIMGSLDAILAKHMKG